MYSDYKKEEEILHKLEQENPKNTYHSFKKKFYYSLPPFSYTLILTELMGLVFFKPDYKHSANTLYVYKFLPLLN